MYRSNVVKDNLSPQWQDTTIELSLLCGGDLDKPVLVTVYDYESDGRHVLMGKFESSVNGLVNASGSEGFSLIGKNGKESGKMIVEKADVAGVTSVEESMQKMSISAPVTKALTGNPTFVDYVSGGCDLNVCVAVDFTGSNGTYVVNTVSRVNNRFALTLCLVLELKKKATQGSLVPFIISTRMTARMTTRRPSR